MRCIREKNVSAQKLCFIILVCTKKCCSVRYFYGYNNFLVHKLYQRGNIREQKLWRSTSKCYALVSKNFGFLDLPIKMSLSLWLPAATFVTCGTVLWCSLWNVKVQVGKHFRKAPICHQYKFVYVANLLATQTLQNHVESH